MIEKRKKTVTVYSVDGEDFDKRAEAIEAVLKRALGGHMRNSRDMITLSELVKAMGEVAFRQTLRELLDLIDSNGNGN